MPTPMYLFIGFIAIGLIFFFSGCIVASKPASGTIEWINYKCGKKFTFCPAPKPLTKFDIIVIFILTASAFGMMLLSASFLEHLSVDAPPFAVLADISLFPVGKGAFYLSHLMWVLALPLLYVFLKNLTGGYLVPISSIILILLDISSLMLSHNSALTGASFFMLTAFYLIYRYTASAKKLYLPFVGITLGIAISFNAQTVIALIGIIAVFVIKEVTLYLANKDKKQTVINSILFIVFCFILPAAIYLTTTSLIQPHSNPFVIFVDQFNYFDLLSFSTLSILSLMVFIGSILALPCCIYQVVKAKDGISLFAIILFVVYILSVLISGLTGLLPIFAIPVIACSFTALHNRKLKGWIITYLITAVLYIGSMFAFILI